MLQTVRGWLEAFASAVRCRDYAAARDCFDVHVIGFGTVAARVDGLQHLEARQWRAVWEATEDFTFHTINVDEQGALAVVATEWASVYVADGTVRQGRATIVLHHRADGWRAVHTHFSLMPRPSA